MSSQQIVYMDSCRNLYRNSNAGNLGNLDVLLKVAKAIEDIKTMGRFARINWACNSVIQNDLTELKCWVVCPN